MAGALIGALRVSLSAETSAFEAGMKRSQRVAATTAKSIQGSFARALNPVNLLKAGIAGFVGALSVGTIIAAGKAALDYAGSLGEIAQQLGVTTKDLQVFRFAAGQVGVKQEELETGLSKLTITLGKVAAGAAAPAKALAAIGVSVDQLKGKNTGEAFRIIADGLEKVKDRSQRAAVEVALFGKSGAQLDNLLSGGSSAINELSAAAEKLGIVLSDEQIAKADETADKLEALKTVLAARIAGVVADNADAILALANALAAVVTAAGDAARALGAFYKYAGQVRDVASQQAQQIPTVTGALVKGATAINPALGAALGFLTGGSGKPKPAPSRVPPPPVIKASGGDIDKFLASGGGSKKAKKARAPREDHTAERALSDAFRFDEDIRRSQMDVLRATQDLSTDYIERATLAVQMLDLEKQSHDAELAYQVELYKLTKGEQGITEAQAAQLQAQYDIKDGLERRKVMQDEQQQRFDDGARLDDVSLELQRDALQSELQNARTAKEQRALQLRILDVSYQIEKARLETVLADKQSSEAAKEEARRRLALMPALHAQDQKAVVAGTRGPLETYKNELPQDLDDINEKLEEIQVRGLKSLEDDLTSATVKALGLKGALGDVVGELIRLALQIGESYLMGGDPLKGLKIGGFATGGYTGNAGVNEVAGVVHGKEYVVNAKATRQNLPLLEAMNAGRLPGMASGGLAGLPIARVRTHGLRIDNDNMRPDDRGHGDTIVNMEIRTPDADSFRRGNRQIRQEYKRRFGS